MSQYPGLSDDISRAIADAIAEEAFTDLSVREMKAHLSQCSHCREATSIEGMCRVAHKIIHHYVPGMVLQVFKNEKHAQEFVKESITTLTGVQDSAMPFEESSEEEA